MKIWIAIGVAAVLTFLIMQQFPDGTKSEKAPSPSPSPEQKPKHSPTFTIKKATAALPSEEPSFVLNQEPEVPPAPDLLQFNSTGIEEPDTMVKLSDFKPTLDAYNVMTVTYGSEPKPNMKIEDRDWATLKHSSLMASDEN